MTLPATTRRSPVYLGNGAVTTFPFTFKVFATTDIQVRLTSAAGVLTTAMLGTDYSVALNADQTISPGGTVVYPVTGSPLATGASLVMIGALPYDQTLALPAGGNFNPVAIERGLDRIEMQTQQIAELAGRAVRAPAGEALADLAGAASRADKLLGFDSLGNPVALAPVGGTAAALATDIASSALAARGAGQVGFAFALNYAAGTVGGLIKNFGIDITQPPYSADKTGVVDCSPAFAAAWAASPGVPIRVPAGLYRMNTSVALYTLTFPDRGVFGNGPKIYGDGIGVTIFDNRVANGPMFDIDSTTGDSHATFKGVLGVEMAGFSVKTTTSPAASTAIRLRTSYMAKLRQLHILGLTGNGIQVQCSVGDNDASNMVSLDQIRVESCLGWGLKFDADSGFNEISFVQGCGTASAAATPPSGGIISKVQMMTMVQCAFTINENCAMFVPGQAGLAANYDLIDTTFENNKKRGLYVTGVDVFKGRNLQFYNNNAYTATNQCEFDGAGFTIRNVDINAVLIRATSGNNAVTAFKISGTFALLDSCRVRNVTWSNFDYTGQARFSGWQFDHVPQTCDIVALSTTSVLFRPNQTIPYGNTSPLRLAGALGGVASTTGEWVAMQIPNGGIGISNASLAASTRYYAYLRDNNGSTVLELATTAFAIDTATGYSVKTGDATRLYVGSVETDAGALFKLTAGGWLNPALTPGSQVGVYNYSWGDSTGRLRIKYATAPTSDVDGAIVGAQV